MEKVHDAIQKATSKVSDGYMGGDETRARAKKETAKSLRTALAELEKVTDSSKLVLDTKTATIAYRTETGGLEWPPDGRPVVFEELLSALRSAIEQAYSLRPKSGESNIEWRGPSSTPSVGLPNGSIPERLSKKGLSGRDPLNELLAVTLQIGMEEGARFTVMHDRDMHGLKTRLAATASLLEANGNAIDAKSEIGKIAFDAHALRVPERSEG